jgi:hypothetical protein
MKIGGLILIIIGVLALAYQGISFVRQENVADIGPLQIKAEKRETIPLPPIVGVVCLVGGIVLLVSDKRTLAT